MLNYIWPNKLFLYSLETSKEYVKAISTSKAWRHLILSSVSKGLNRSFFMVIPFYDEVQIPDMRIIHNGEENTWNNNYSIEKKESIFSTASAQSTHTHFNK